MEDRFGYNDGLNLLRGIAALGIVGCHLGMNPHSMVASRLLHFTDFNVLLFAVLSGYLMVMSLGRNEDLSLAQVIRKKAKRLLIPYFVWSALYLISSPLFNILTGRPVINPKFCSSLWWLRVVVDGQAALHLWFLIHLFYISFATIVISRTKWKYLLDRRFLLLFSIVMIFLSAIGGGNPFTYYAVRLYAGFSLGMTIFNYRSMLWRIGAPTYGVVALVVASGHLSGIFTSRFIGDYILSVPIVILFAKMPFSRSAIVDFIGSSSFLVYLIHPLICAGVAVVAKRIFVSPYGFLPVISVWFVDCTLALGASFATCSIMRKAYAKSVD